MAGSTTEDEPPDVLLVYSELGFGGTERVIANLATGWHERGRRVAVATYAQASVDFYPLPAAVPTRRMQTSPTDLARHATPRWLNKRITESARLRPGLDYDVLHRRVTARVLFALLQQMGRVRWLRRTIEELRPTTVLSFGPNMNVTTLAAARGLATRVVLSERNDVDLQPLDFRVAALRAHFYRQADVVTANSHGTLDALARWVPADKLRFVPNPLLLPPMARGGPPPPGFAGPCVLVVGRLAAQKEHALLLDAFALLPAELDGWRLVVVGSGPLEGELRARADALGLTARVDWHGRTRDPFAFYRHADVFALPSRYEGMPNALLEAMSFGLAPIVSDASTGPLEVVRDDETGLVVPTGDPAALAAAITRLATEPDLRRRLGHAARQEVARFEGDEALAAWDDALGLIPTDRLQ